MKEKVKRAGILTFVFLIAVIVFSFLTNQGNADMTADMGGATLPRIQIVSGEYEINPLVGYVSEMNVGKMRSTITPVDFLEWNHTPNRRRSVADKSADL